MGKSKKKGGGQNQPGKKKKGLGAGRRIQFSGGGSSAHHQQQQQSNTAGASASTAKKVEVSLSISTEAALRDIISQLWSQTPQGVRKKTEKGENIGKGPNNHNLREEIKGIYDEISRLGFTAKQVEEGLANSLEYGDVSKENALDWLCLNFAADELPRKLASGAFSVGSAGNVTVVSTGDLQQEGFNGSSKGIGKDKDAPSPLERKRREEQKKREEEERKREEERRQREHEEKLKKLKEEAKRKKEEEEAQNKDWIKRYMDTYDESESEDDFMMMGGDPRNHVGGDDKWSIYADPREVQRRKATRPDNPDEAIAQIAQELEAAKEEASNAKAEGDKQKQKEAGMMIRDLKEELKALGISDESQLSKPAQGEEEEEEETLGMNFAAMDMMESELDAQKEDKPKKVSDAESNSSDGEGEFLGGGMFDEDAEDDYVPTQKLASAEKEISQEWLQETKKKVKSKPQKDQPKKHEQLRMPKVLLQQHCQRNQLSNPKYEKLQTDTPKAFRYSVIVEVQTTYKGRKKRIEQKRFEVPEEEDSWSNIQDAQNSVAAKALFHMTNQQPLYRIIPSPYREMWLKWESELSANDNEVLEEKNTERDDFIEGLLQRLREKKSIGDKSKPSKTLDESAAAESGQREGFRKTKRRAARGPSNKVLLAELEKREATKTAAGVPLPISEINESISSALEDNDFLIVCGETGSGKTTQVPQYILDNLTKQNRSEDAFVVCTQPRRIAAVSVAERVASERGEPAPGQRGSRVGYHVRLDASTTADTKLLFCTTGILLRKLIGDPLLSSVSHVVIDEVHERTVQSDLLLAMIRNIVYKRKLNSSLAPLKLVLMSATIDTTLLSAYLDHCPVLSVGGRTFDVQQNYLEDVYEMLDYQLDQDNPASHRLRSENINVLVGSQTKDKTIRAGWGDDICKDEILNPEYNPDSYYDYSSKTRRNLMRLNEEKIDYELIQSLLVHIDDNFEEGAVLVFLPGMAEINNLYDQLISSYHFGKDQNKRDWVMPLHSNISPEEQRRVFKNPPRGTRKFVLATNIAETSITIDDIVYVLDAGHVKERQYDASRGLGMLVEGWISAASAKQRKGRAGRVRPGVCFSLFTRDRANKMRKHPVPEIMRVPLEEVCLHIRKLQLGLCQDFLGSMVQPPHSKAIDAAVKALTDIGALTEDESLTPLGHHLAGLPVDCRIGKLLLLGSILGCLSSILTVAACLSYKTPFASSYEERDAADRCKAALCFQNSNTIASGQFSDHLAMVAAYNGWLETKRSKGAGAARAYARSQHLSQATLYMITDLRKQLVMMLQDIGFVSVDKGGRRSDILESPECKYNVFSHNPTFVKNCLCAALYPNIAMLDTTGEFGSKKTWIDEKGDQLFVHPSSVNHGEAISFPHPFLVYLEKIKTKRVYLHDTTIVSPYSLMLFGGEMHILHERGIVEIDKWIKLRVPAQTAVLFKRMRQIINGHLISRLNAPGSSKGETSSSTTTLEQNAQLMNTVSRLFDDEEKLSSKRHH